MRIAPIPGCTGYYASENGRILSYWRGRYLRLYEEPRVLAEVDQGYGGYIKFSPGRGKNRLVHRAVWEAFNGPIPEGLQVCHINGKSDDNQLSNLKIGTQTDNEADKTLHGTRRTLDNHPSAKLTSLDVQKARTLKAQGHSLSEIITELDLNISKISLASAISRRTWKEVP